jgi:hypothetical protein
MTSRRELLQIGIAAATAWPLASRADPATGTPAAAARPIRLPLYKVVYDVRFAASVAFARRATELAVAVHAIEGDMTRFWYDDLYHRWKREPVAIAGLTAHGPLFCFEQLARDQRMRVVFRAEHRPAGADGIEHRFSGPVGMLGAAGGAVAAADWPARIADLLTDCPSGRSEIVTAASRTLANGATSVDGESLYSWVIAPAVRA